MSSMYTHTKIPKRSRWQIAEAKRHENPFEGPRLRVEGGFFDIFVMDSNQM